MTLVISRPYKRNLVIEAASFLVRLIGGRCLRLFRFVQILIPFLVLRDLIERRAMPRVNQV